MAEASSRGQGELGPVAGGKVDDVDVGDLGQFGHQVLTLCHPTAKHFGRELTGDHRDGDLVPTVVVEDLRIACDSSRLRNSDASEHRTETHVEIDQVFLVDSDQAGRGISPFTSLRSLLIESPGPSGRQST